MNNLLLQARTAKNMADIENSRAHAFVIAGSAGSGKKTLAREIVSRKLGLKSSLSLNNYPYFLFIAPDNLTIGIDRVREIQHFLSRKTTGTRVIRRAVIIADAHFMTREAQNALLKSLEEPPDDTILILSTASILSLLPTVRSRSQIINVTPVSKSQAVEYFTGKGFSATEVEKAHALTDGSAGLMHALLNEQDKHPLIQHIELAKELLTSSVYERLLRIEEISKNKNELPVLLRSLKLVCRAALASAAASSSTRTSKLVGSLSIIQQAESAYMHNANSKLLLTNLFLHL